MKKQILTSLSILLLSGCGTVTVHTTLNQARVVFSPETFVETGAVSSGKRLIFLHGIWATHTQVTDDASFRTIITALTNAGWQVVTFDYPYTELETFADGGATYLPVFLARVEQAIQYADANYGHCSTNVIGGFSFGGLHAMIAAQSLPNIDGYFGHEPLINMWRLQPFSQMLFPAFTPEPQKLTTVPGFITYGTADTIVDYHDDINEIAAISNAGGSIGEHAYIGMGHAIPRAPEDFSDLIHWLLAEF